MPASSLASLLSFVVFKDPWLTVVYDRNKIFPTRLVAERCKMPDLFPDKKTGGIIVLPLEFEGAIAKQYVAEAGILSGELWFQLKFISPHHQVEVTVIVYVGTNNCRYQRPLRTHGQGSDCKPAITLIYGYNGLGDIYSSYKRIIYNIGLEEFLYCPPGVVGRFQVLFFEAGQLCGHLPPHVNGEVTIAVMGSCNLLYCTILVEVVDPKLNRLVFCAWVWNIRSRIAKNQIL